MSRLYKRGNVYWFDFRINGIRYRQSTGQTKRRDAEDFLHDEREKAKTGECAGTKKIKDCTVTVLAAEYSKWVKFQKSYGSKRFFIKHIVETFGNLRVRDLNARIVEQWQTMRLERRKPATINRITSCLRHMITQGQKWEMVDEETAKRVKSVKLLKEDNKRLRFLTLEECHRLIDCCQEHLKPIVTIALHTGMRRGEILGLKWEQVDLKHGFILLDISKNGERREIPINTTLEYLFKEIPRSVESMYVFAGKNGNPLTDIKNSFHAALKNAGILDFRFHDLRHTFASHLVMAGVDLTSVKELLGHKDITMTLRYSHLAPGHKRKAVQVLDRIMEKDEDMVLNNGHNLDTILEKNQNGDCPKSLEEMVGATGFEPATS
ncbi:site specific recombinase [Candidatus Scalindua japonica]|uniref:Site specific recombinase n=1 Tax=Candidatus Scalindua japonica TaxID=1284222 RepID=A0A286U2T4_9BACT|nr:site-specific integrase [Candidatus Scalindua japonica]GAX62381.1 site specific recombinase [Candidatus Scalindua japonica]